MYKASFSLKPLPRSFLFAAKFPSLLLSQWGGRGGSDSEVHIPSPPSSHNSEHFFLMSFYTVKLISRSVADIKVCMIVSLISLPCKLVMGLVKLLLYLELINVSCKE